MDSLKLAMQPQGIIRAVRRKPQSVSKRFYLLDQRSSLAPPNHPAISVVIPALNEEAQIAATLAALRSDAAGRGAEIIVVDGGSAVR